MKNIFVDCDILLDVALKREPFFHASSERSERRVGRAIAKPTVSFSFY